MKWHDAALTSDEIMKHADPQKDCGDAVQEETEVPSNLEEDSRPIVAVDDLE